MHGGLAVVELDHHHTGGFGTSPWATAAMMGHHPSAATMMQMGPHAHSHPDSHHHHHPPYHGTSVHPGHPAGPTIPIDLHVPQGFPYYRYREDALCWSDRKDGEVGHSTSVNARILELRKEKSRDAARSRRGKENYEFYELAKMLPLPAAITSQLDKASIIRLTISYLKLRDFSGHGDPPWTRDMPSTMNKTLKGSRSRSPNSIAVELFEQHQGGHILQALDGFAFALAADGRFLYISETVSIYLGLSQVEMTGSSLFDYIHTADHSEVAEQLGLGLSQNQGLGSPGSANSEDGAGSNTGTANPDVSSVMSLSTTTGFKGVDRAFCIRMKSTLTKRGCHFKSSGYRVVLLLCRLRPQYTFPHNRKSSPPLMGAVCLAIALPPPSVHEIRLESDMFVTRVNFDFRIAHCEPKVSELLDYTAEELTGMNLYTLCHGEDAQRLRKCHVDLINKGQMITHYYRILNKNGGYTWIQTCATVVCNSKNVEEQNIICVNYVISCKEYENLVMDCSQLEDHSHKPIKDEDVGRGNDPENSSPDNESGDGRRNRNREHHLTPAHMEDGSKPSEGRLDGGGRGHMDHAAHLNASNPSNSIPSSNNVDSEHAQINILHANQMKKLTTSDKPISNMRKPHKRKLSTPLHREEESSCCSSDEDDKINPCRTQKTRYPNLSPASSSSAGGIGISSSPKSVAIPIVEEHHERNVAISAGTSVKDLENAMSKHLPMTDKNSLHQPTDFSTDTLLKQQQRSTIQWIGAHHLNQLSHQHPQTHGAPLPASALLRQLYANRESVIRANIHASTTLPPSVNRSSPSGPYYNSGDVNHVGPLPTPPGSEGSYPEQYPPPHNQKLNDNNNFSTLVPSYSATGGPGPYSADYHNAMTPPSSVSPRDKHQQPIHSSNGPGTFDSTTYNDVLRHQYLGPATTSEIPTQPLPLKPQAYTPVHHNPLDPYPSAASTLDQSQFYHSASGFHIYHPSSNKSSSAYSEGLKNHSNWYSTPT